ncbi:MAG: glycerol-3-phosphate responsive antiterminator [Oscillospiraceae bacterium]|nr:glycerol-3-phosphate responsive antiterminator [Oscillospiraceae bacterium]
MEKWAANPVIAAVQSGDAFEQALASGIDTIFLLHANIMALGAQLDAARAAQKKVYLHVDLTDGIGKDKSGIRFIASLGANGVISTRGNLIRFARECGLAAVQRCFIVDSHSIDTAIESISQTRPYSIEVMPGVIPRVIANFAARIDIPVIAGGLIDSKGDVAAALAAGAAAVSTGKQELWN